MGIIRQGQTDITDADQISWDDASTGLNESNVQGMGETLNEWLGITNGLVIQDTDVAVTSAASIITVALSASVGTDLTFKFSDGITNVDVTSPMTATLTAGTDTSPQENWAYVLSTDPTTLVISTSGFPSAEHAPVARIIVQSAVTVAADGVLKQHNYTDHLINSIPQGHITHINDWIREQWATWISGISATFSGSGTGTINVGVTSGQIKQLHNQTFPSISSPADVYAINDSVTPYNNITNLGGSILTDSLGGSLSGRWYTLVLWGVGSEGGSGESKLFINIPSGSYNNESNAIEDVSAFNNFSIPTEYKGTGFLIHKLILRNQGDTTFTVSGSSLDLRGQLPNTVAGTATSAPTEFQDSTFRIFDNIDPTAKTAFELSGITTATTRTVTMPDRDTTLDTVTEGSTDTNLAANRIPYSTGSKITSDADLSFDGTNLSIANAPTADDHAANKAYVDTAIQGIHWQEPVLDRQVDATLDPGASPGTGDRYILEDTAALNANFGTIAGVGDDDIVEYDGADFVVVWAAATEGEGGASWVSDEDKVYVFNGTAWVALGTIISSVWTDNGSRIEPTNNTRRTNIGGGTYSGSYNYAYACHSGTKLMWNLRDNGGSTWFQASGKLTSDEDLRILMGDPFTAGPSPVFDLNQATDSITLTAANISLDGDADVVGVLSCEGFSPGIRTISGASEVQATTDRTVYADASSNNIAFALGDISFFLSDFELVIKKTDSTTNTVTINANAGETIDGASSFIFYQENESITLQPDGTNWKILSRSIPQISTETSIQTKIGDGSLSSNSILGVATESSNQNLILERNNSSAAGASLIATKSRGTAASPTAVLSNDDVLYFEAKGYDGSSYLKGAHLNFEASENWSGSGRGTALNINTILDTTTTVVSTFKLTGAGHPLFPQHGTTANAANAYINSGNGDLLRSTSSLRYKENVTDIEIDTSKVYDLRPVSFNSINEDETDRYFGLIAEEVAETIPDLTEYSLDGQGAYQPESVKYQLLSVLLLEELKKLKARIEILEGM